MSEKQKYQVLIWAVITLHRFSRHMETDTMTRGSISPFPEARTITPYLFLFSEKKFYNLYN